MQVPVVELAWTEYAGFAVLLGGIFLSAMATWSWARVCAGHLRKLEEKLAAPHDQPAGEFAEAWHRQREEDQAEREIYRLGEKLRAQSREDLLRAQREEEAGCSLGHENCGTAGKIRWDEAEQALTSRPETPAEAPPQQDPETTAAGLTAVPGGTPPLAGTGQGNGLCSDKTCIWFGKFDHVWHLLPGQEGEFDE